MLNATVIEGALHAMRYNTMLAMLYLSLMVSRQGRMKNYTIVSNVVDQQVLGRYFFKQSSAKFSTLKRCR